MVIMKKESVLSFVSLLILLLFSSCSLETDNEPGELEGMWHLVRIENVATGEQADVSERKIFWSFQGKLLELDDKEGLHRSYLYRYSLNGSQLALTTLYMFDRENGDQLITEYDSTLDFYGIKTLTPTYSVERSKGSHLELNNGSERLSFDKF